jgi:hypothetical protein
MPFAVKDKQGMPLDAVTNCIHTQEVSNVYSKLTLGVDDDANDFSCRAPGHLPLSPQVPSFFLSPVYPDVVS